MLAVTADLVLSLVNTVLVAVVAGLCIWAVPHHRRGRDGD